MGWLRLVGSLKSYVFFAKYRLFYRTLLQKRPMILRSLLTVATPYHVCKSHVASIVFEWVMSLYESHVICEWVMSLHESQVICHWVMSLHVICEWVMSLNESKVICEWVMSSHVVSTACCTRSTMSSVSNPTPTLCNTLYCNTIQHSATPSTGWRRPIGCLKLQVIFRKRATMYRALSRKITSRDKASCDSTPPCTATHYNTLQHTILLHTVTHHLQPWALRVLCFPGKIGVTVTVTGLSLSCVILILSLI